MPFLPSRLALGWIVGIIGLALALIACGSSDTSWDDRPNSSGNVAAPPAGGAVAPDAVGGKSGMPCAVDKVIRPRCQACHGAHPAGGASVSLVTQEDFLRDYNGKKVLEHVKERIHDQARIMPPSPNKLAADELATLDAWLGQGAPASSDTCDLPAAGVKPLSCKPDLIVKPSKQFTLPNPAPNDVYMCFGATVNRTKKRHIIAFSPHVDNPSILHHIEIFRSPTPFPADPVVCSGVGSGLWQLVSGWAPGGGNIEFPPEAGYPEEVGPTFYVVQVHYNSAGGKHAGQSDASGYEMCTTEDLRPNDAGVAAFGTLDIAIPPRSKLTLTCAVTGIEFIGKTFIFNSAHMHKLGTGLTSERVPLDGSPPELIGGTDNFDFNSQVSTVLQKPVTLKPGDIVRTKCSWKNPGDLPVLFGETSDSEMCYNFFAYYPAIPAYPWTTSAMFPCIPTLGQ